MHDHHVSEFELILDEIRAVNCNIRNIDDHDVILIRSIYKFDLFFLFE